MNIKKGEPLKTVITITTGFILVFLATKLKWALTVAFIVGIIGISSTWLTDKIDFLWMKLTKLLGYIMPNVLLSIVFFIFLTPLAIISKIFSKKDSLQMKDNTSSNYITVNKDFGKESLENPW